MSFRIWTIFWLFALVASALATFGVFGVFAAVFVLAIWGWFLFAPTSTTLRAHLVVVLIALFFLVELVLFPVVSSRRASPISQCQSQLMQLISALHVYHELHQHFPPAYVADADGHPLWSWRVPLLPSIEEQALYNKLDLTKAWNDPINQRWTSLQIEVLICPSHVQTAPVCDYVAVIGPNCAFDGGTGRSIQDFSDDLSETIVFIEAPHLHVNWAEPRDLTFDEAVDLLSSPANAENGHLLDRGFFYKAEYGRNVVFADGNPVFLFAPLDRDVAAALLTISGGEEIDDGMLVGYQKPELDYQKCYALSLFVLLSLAPLIRLAPAMRSIAASQSIATQSEIDTQQTEK